MNINAVDLNLIIDRSGSMASRVSDSEGGIKEFIRNQKEQPGECLLTLVQFDDKYEFVHKGKPIQEINDHFKLEPRGGTALLDAVGKTVFETGERLRKLPEEKRPGVVIVVIVTDGEENSSKEYNSQQVREMIKHQQDVYKWQFTFLGADLTAFQQSEVVGVGGPCGSVGATGAKGIMAGYQAVSNLVYRLRASSMGGQTLDNTYTSEELVAMNQD